MTDFQSKFDPTSGPICHKMLGTMRALAMEINTGMRFSNKGNIVTHLKQIGWIPTSTKGKKAALTELVRQSTEGFGYQISDSVKRALEKE